MGEAFLAYDRVACIARARDVFTTLRTANMLAL